ncbi:MAG: AarF/UbiB family protein [Anaeromicrobium sp.]|uniref:ABC1 kinase family protein n=1 Tax=Anaeromicrobium sp. TaxID=1929132 RepID=UPI0025F134BE|nr:AarF/UbiB family protein [Anaeromicrobium sp.]MCT4593749.1 AarF/UbiB family protein [Anaeromicrobium sp.]
MIPISRYKHIKRYKEIIRVFMKYGFGLALDQLGILNYLDIKNKIIKKEGNERQLSIGERLRLALEELGPTFIKLGQIMSTRPDLLPENIINELEKLHDDAPTFSFQEVKSSIEYELGEKLEDIFTHFNKNPLGAASIAQVHLGKLKTGEQVVVKIQRPRIEKKIEEDIMILKDLAWFIDNHTKYGKLYEFSTMIGEFQNILRNELDFIVEGENAEIFKENLSKDKKIIIPTVHWDYTTRRILTLEHINGIGLNDFQSLKEANVDFKFIARKISKSIFEQILRDGIYHGDPHPGNIMILPNNNIAFLDFGMIGKLREERKKQFLKILLGITFRNSKLIVEAITGLNIINKRSDIKKLQYEIDNLRDKYIELPLNDIKLGEFFNEIFNLAFKYNLTIPNEFTMLVKTLGTMEGVVEKLDPELNILEVAEPMAKKLMLNIFSPKAIKNNLAENIFDYASLIHNFPDFILNFFRKLEDEDYNLNLKFIGTGGILKHFDKITNKISFSIALLSLSIIIAGLIVGFGMAARVGTQEYLFSLSLLKFGLVAALLMYLWLIFSIFKTGRF